MEKARTVWPKLPDTLHPQRLSDQLSASCFKPEKGVSMGLFSSRRNGQQASGGFQRLSYTRVDFCFFPSVFLPIHIRIPCWFSNIHNGLRLYAWLLISRSISVLCFPRGCCLRNSSFLSNNVNGMGI